MKAPRKITSTFLEALRPGRDTGEIIIDAGVRGQGALILRVTKTGKPIYYRYFHGGQRRFELVGHFDPKGSRHWRDDDQCFRGAALTLVAAREGFRELSQLAAAHGDLKAHFAAEEAKRAEAKRAADAEARAGTFGDLLDAYVKHLEDAKKPSAADVASTFKRCIRKPFPELTAQRANTITAEDIQRILARLVEQGVTRGVNVARSYMRAAFAYAGTGHDLDPRRLARDGKRFGLTGNPVALIPPIADFERMGTRVLEPAEIRRYAEIIADPEKVPNSIVRAALQLHLWTGGQRVRQLLAANWPAYDLDTGTVTLLDPKGRGGPRKHVVPLPPEAIAILKALGQVNGEVDWPLTTDGKTRLRHETLVKAVGDIRGLKKGSEPEFATPFTLRDIRRTVETTLASFGVSREIRAQLLSHGRGDKIAQTYDHHSYLAEKRQALEQWRDFLNGRTERRRKVIPMKKRAQTA